MIFAADLYRPKTDYFDSRELMLRLIAAVIAASIVCLIYRVDLIGFISLVLTTYFAPEALFVVVVILTISAGFDSQSK